jgi:hypothetical protein
MNKEQTQHENQNVCKDVEQPQQEFEICVGDMLSMNIGWQVHTPNGVVPLENTITIIWPSADNRCSEEELREFIFSGEGC